MAVVTGGARGIGYETIKALQESGAQTAIVDVNAELGQKAARELETGFFQADLTKSEEVKKVADQVQEKYGRLDIAFNNAGIGVNVPSEDCSDEDWLRVVNVNLNAVFFCCREFGKIMLRQGKGSIINTASMSGIVSNTTQPQSAYSASKGGVRSQPRSSFLPRTGAASSPSAILWWTADTPAGEGLNQLGGALAIVSTPTNER